MPLSLEKLERQAPGLVSLRKKADDVIERKNLLGITLPVYYLTDYSISTSYMWGDGTMQTACEEVLALATAFTEDGSIEYWAFSDFVAKLGVVTIDNYQGAPARLVASKQMGGTRLAEAIRAMTTAIAGNPGGLGATRTQKKGGFLGFGGKEEVVQEPSVHTTMRGPALVIVQTDGDPSNDVTAAQAMVDASVHPIFWQFQAMGDGPFHFLSTLNDPDTKVQPYGRVDPTIAKIVEKRLIDNAGVFFGMPGRPDLYDGLLNELPDYLPRARTAGLIP